MNTVNLNPPAVVELQEMPAARLLDGLAQRDGRFAAALTYFNTIHNLLRAEDGQPIRWIGPKPHEVVDLLRREWRDEPTEFQEGAEDLAELMDVCWSVMHQLAERGKGSA